MKRFIFINLLCFLLATCNSNEKIIYDEESNWLLENEDSINNELDRRIVEDLNLNNADTNWQQKSIVFTQYDTTILGIFAKRINAINECYEIEYTFSKNFTDKKIITILSDTVENCKNLREKKFLMLDSTTKFKIFHQ